MSNLPNKGKPLKGEKKNYKGAKENNVLENEKNSSLSYLYRLEYII
jgi:hypothetical protein